MNEKPIIFSGEMMRAILEGRKTQTRRVIPVEWLRCLDIEEPEDKAKTIAQCPYGRLGGKLWVRESFLIDYEHGENTRGHIPPAVYYRATDKETPWTKPSWKPPMYMPRWASRITLEIVNVRVKRVQEISTVDILAEATPVIIDSKGLILYLVGAKPFQLDHYVKERDPKAWNDFDYLTAYYGHLWDSINHKRGYGWDANLWVWVIEFKRVEP